MVQYSCSPWNQMGIGFPYTVAPGRSKLTWFLKNPVEGIPITPENVYRVEVECNGTHSDCQKIGGNRWKTEKIPDDAAEITVRAYISKVPEMINNNPPNPSYVDSVTIPVQLANS